MQQYPICKEVQIDNSYFENIEKVYLFIRIKLELKKTKSQPLKTRSNF